MKKPKDSDFAIIQDKRCEKKLRLYPHHCYNGKVMIPYVKNWINHLNYEKNNLMKLPLSLDYQIYYHKVMAHLLEHLKENEHLR